MTPAKLVPYSSYLAVGLLLPWLGVTAQVIPAQRIFPEAWRNAGYRGGALPGATVLNVRDFGATGEGKADDRAAILAAFEALGGEPGVVYFPKGKYLIQSPIDVPSGVVLRGENASGTLLQFDFVEDAIRFSGKQVGDWIAVTETADIHSRALSVAEAETFSPGDYALLTQDDDPSWNITDSWAIGSAGQVVRIAEIEGNRLHLERPLRHGYPVVRKPRIRRILPIQHSGIENLRLERQLAAESSSRNNKHTVVFQNAANCWMRGVHSRMAFGSHVAVDYSTGVQITGCYFDDAHEHDGGGSGYGVRLQFRSGECLVEDNIFRHLRHSVLLQAGSNGNVIAYNYSRDGKSDSHPGFASDISLHGNYPYANLFEGNIVEHIWLDNSHNGANGPLNTIFRNRAGVAGYNMSDASAHGQNVVGNEFARGNILAQLVAGNGYRFLGTNHFTYANHSAAVGIQPPGTAELADISYYLADSPSEAPVAPKWWTIPESLPVIGPPKTCPATKNIPAKARWQEGGPFAVPVLVDGCRSH